MSKNLQSFSIMFLGVCILFGCLSISQSLNTTPVKQDTKSEEKFRYELISPNESNIILFDKLSGVYWRKYIEPNEGPTDWEEQKPLWME